MKLHRKGPDPNKLTQVVALVLRASGNEMSIMRLVKLLYIADREAIKALGRSISGDLHVAMEHGPVLSHVYNLHKGGAYESSWADSIESLSRHQLRLVNNPGTSLLNDWEVKKLTEVVRRHVDSHTYELRNLTHQFPEWQRNDPGKSSTPIPIEHVIEAVSKTPLEAEDIRDDVRARQQIDALFGPA